MTLLLFILPPFFLQKLCVHARKTTQATRENVSNPRSISPARQITSFKNIEKHKKIENKKRTETKCLRSMLNEKEMAQWSMQNCY